MTSSIGSEHMKCAECGAAMEIDQERVALVCPYCGNREALDEITAARLNSQDELNIATQALREAKAQRKFQEEKLKHQQSKRKGRKRAIAIVLGAFVFFFAAVIVYGVVEDFLWEQQYQQRLSSPYDWPTNGLAQMIDQPSETNGDIEVNSNSCFRIEVPDSNFDFSAYVESCKARGFTVDAESEDYEYSAYNAEGYRVDVYHYHFSNAVEISVEAPLALGTIYWPTIGLGALIPAPESSQGAIESDSSTSFRAYVGNTTPEQFEAYIVTCMDAGFNVDYHRTTKRFYADNEDGVQLTLEYEGFNTVRITMYDRSSK